MISENKLFVKVEASERYKPLTVPFEAFIILWGKLDLVGLYLGFILLAQVNLGYVPQPKLAKLFGLSYLTYLKKRKELEKLNLIKVKIPKHNLTQISISSNRLWGLIKSIRPSYKKYKTYSANPNLNELVEYLENTGKMLGEALQKPEEKNGQQELLHNIYIYNTNKTKKTNNKTYGKTYPIEDYNMVLGAFRKYKGVGLMGPEITYHRRAIKMMFQAERKPKQIIDFMKWLHDNESNDETAWVKTWTIWTVQKKIAEFIGGKLQSSTGKEDLTRI